MKPFRFSLFCGILFGAIDVLLMMPLNMPDKPIAMLAAFLNRFSIGFIIPLIRVSIPMWLMGGIVGFLLSLPDAIITRAYFPIITVGVIGGLMVGWASGKRISKKHNG